jgi:hypothetical protein
LNGKDGRDGKAGRDGYDGVDGLDGKDGKDGRAGRDGVDGSDGVDGIDGKDGRNGLDGRDGTSCSVRTVTGGVEVSCTDGTVAVIKNGRDGRDGADGMDGRDAAPCSVAPYAGGARISCPDGSSQIIVNGKDGKDGKNGLDGSSCSAVDVAGGARVVCSDGTTAFLRDGVDGRDGRDGTSCSVRAVTGGSEIVCSDGTKTIVKNGTDGLNGTNGANGTNGVDGKSCSVRYVQDGAEIRCGSDAPVLIKNGKDGLNGLNGTNGTNGSSCSAVQITGGARIVCTDGTTAMVKDGGGCSVSRTVGGALVTCENGTTSLVFDGLNGINGTNGTNGSNGLDGSSCRVEQTTSGAKVVCEDGSTAVILNGRDGLDGQDGMDGSNGTQCTVTRISGGAKVTCTDGSTSIVYDGQNGTNGTNGTNGIDGINGTNGTNGLNGTSCSVSQTSSGGVITCSDGTTAIVKNGLDGKDGKSCSVTPVAGGAKLFCSDGTTVTVLNGQNGTNGTNGTDGINGLNGTSCSVVQQTSGAKITCSDGTTAFVKNGVDGASCSVSQISGGAKVTCTDGKVAYVYDGKDGVDGKDGLNGTSCRVETVPDGAKIICPDGSTTIINKCVTCGCSFLCVSDSKSDKWNACNPLPPFAINLVGFGRLIFVEKGKFVETENGSAKIIGVVALEGKPGRKFNVEINLSSIVLTGSPYKELRSSAFDIGGPVDTRSWRYYSSFSGTLTGLGELDGAVVYLSKKSTNFQVGVGANGKNANYGGWGKFIASVSKQPSLPISISSHEAEVSIDIGACDKYTTPPPTGSPKKPKKLWGVDFDDGEVFGIDDYKSSPGSVHKYSKLKWKDGTTLRDIGDGIRAMAIDKSGMAFFAVDKTLGSFAPPVIVALDLKTISLTGSNIVTVVGSVRTNWSTRPKITGLSFDPSDGSLYAVSNGGTNYESRLLVISKATAAVNSDRGAMPMNGGRVKSPEDVKFDLSGNLYVSDVNDSHLNIINKTTSQVISNVHNNTKLGLGLSQVSTTAIAYDDQFSVIVAVESLSDTLFQLNGDHSPNQPIRKMTDQGLTNVQGLDFW